MCRVIGSVANINNVAEYDTVYAVSKATGFAVITVFYDQVLAVPAVPLLVEKSSIWEAYLCRFCHPS